MLCTPGLKPPQATAGRTPQADAPQPPCLCASRACSVQEHVHQSLPTVLHARRQLQQTASAAVDATYAANHSREFAGTLRTALPASLHRMEASLRDASWAASEVTRQHKEQQAGGSGSGSSSVLGSLVPQRLLGLWQGGGGGIGGSREASGGGNGMYSR